MTGAGHIHAGQLRHRAELQRAEQTPDGGGGSSVSWVTERPIWCAIEPLSGRESLEAMRVQSSVSHRIRARWAEDITPQKRITFRGKVYELHAVRSPSGLRDFVEIDATEGVPT